MKKKVLIVGNSPKAYAIAKKLSEENDVYITPSSDTLKEFVTCLDIREDNVKELLDFALENGIDMTIPVSEVSIKSDITSLFLKHNQNIFAPTSSAAEITYDKCRAKKTLYKLHIQTPKFGIFEKQNMAVDYLKNQKIPFVLKTNDNNSAVVLTSVQQAKIIIDSISIDRSSKIIIEDYVYGTPFSFYAITDGYKALPIGSSIVYKYSLEGNGGQLTSGAGSVAPNYKLSIEHEYYLMDNVIYPVIESLEKGYKPYIGIIGVSGILSDDGEISILGWKSFLDDCDSAAILETIDEDLYKLFESCIIGSFSDETDVIQSKNVSAVSVVLSCISNNDDSNIINGIENLDEDTVITYNPCVCKNKYLEYEASKGPVLILTSIASSASKASEKVYAEVNEISFNGIKYRKDICSVTL